jgi:hypothetical protein
MARKERVFSERQAAELLKRASELQAEAGGEDSHAMSFEELQQVASEAGIDPRFLEQAALDVRDRTDLQTRLLGAPPTYELERTVQGALTEHGWNEMLLHLVKTYGTAVPGQFSGNSGSCNYRHALGYVEFTAIGEGAQTHLRMKAHIDGGLTLTWIATCILMLGSAAALFDEMGTAPGLVATAIAWLLMFFSIRGVCGGWYREDRKKADALLSDLGAKLEMRDGVRTQPSPLPIQVDTLDSRLQA